MPLFRRHPAPAPPAAADPAAAAALLTRAQRAQNRAEEVRDREPATRARLDTLYLQAAAALHGCASPAEIDAWLGLADLRRYQKGRRTDTLDAYGRALAFDRFSAAAWDAYLDYFTYAPTAADLLAAVAGIAGHSRRPRRMATFRR